MHAFGVIVLSILVVATLAAPPNQGSLGNERKSQDHEARAMKNSLRKVRSVGEMMKALKSNPMATLGLNSKSLSKEMREELKAAMHSKRSTKIAKRSAQQSLKHTMAKLKSYLEIGNTGMLSKSISKRSALNSIRAYKNVAKRSTRTEKDLKQIATQLQSMVENVKAAFSSKK